MSTMFNKDNLLPAKLNPKRPEFNVMVITREGDTIVSDGICAIKVGPDNLELSEDFGVSKLDRDIQVPLKFISNMQLLKDKLIPVYSECFYISAIKDNEVEFTIPHHAMTTKKTVKLSESRELSHEFKIIFSAYSENFNNSIDVDVGILIKCLRIAKTFCKNNKIPENRISVSMGDQFTPLEIIADAGYKTMNILVMPLLSQT